MLTVSSEPKRKQVVNTVNSPKPAWMLGFTSFLKFVSTSVNGRLLTGFIEKGQKNQSVRQAEARRQRLLTLYLPHPATQGVKSMIRPPFITRPLDSHSQEFKLDCLAWWLCQSKTKPEIQDYLKRQKPDFAKTLKPHLQKCEAWVLVNQCTRRELRYLLLRTPEAEREELRELLNEYWPVAHLAKTD